MKNLLLFLLVAASPAIANEQAGPIRNAITLDSGIPLSEAQQGFAVEHYEIRTEVFPQTKSIAGSSTITFDAIRALATLELDFDGHFNIHSVSDVEGPLDYERDSAKIYIALRELLPAGSRQSVTIVYDGQPHEAERPPWSGGFQWSETESGRPWVATAIQGEGCDLWWPCVDHPQREPNGLDLYFTVDPGLSAAANGVLIGVEELEDGRRTFHWRTRLTTNTYGVALNVGPYILLEDTYTSVNGTDIPIQFWVTEDNVERGRELMAREFALNLDFFERKIGPYPWGEEKLGVVETPHLGMEHQTINAYGNQFRRGDYGYDDLFNHELAHEWFGNVMTHKTVSDMWLHEGTGFYMQPEFAREVIGDAAFYSSMYQAYLGIQACNPIAPRDDFSVDELYFNDVEGRGPGSDIYAKGGWVLESLRYVIGDEKFWDAIRVLVFDTTEPERLQPPIQARLRSTDDFMHIASDIYGSNLDWFFEVYTRRGPLPELAVSETTGGVLLEWQTTDNLTFPMPIPVRVNGQIRRIEFEGNKAVIDNASIAGIQVDPFMNVLRKLPIVPTCEERWAEEAAAAQ